MNNLFPFPLATAFLIGIVSTNKQSDDVKNVKKPFYVAFSSIDVGRPINSLGKSFTGRDLA